MMKTLKGGYMSLIEKMAEERLSSQEEEKERYESFILNGGAERVEKNVRAGRAIKPCGRECREFGYLIISYFNHSSFQNFSRLMNDREFILTCASISPDPKECKNYFYNYVNNNLKRDKKFRLQFLKAIYLNKNVYTIESIYWFVEEFGFQEENKKILADLEFKKEVEARLAEEFEMPKYDLDGNDRKKLREYKILRNDTKVKNANHKTGIERLLDQFAKEKPKEFSRLETLVDVEKAPSLGEEEGCPRVLIPDID